jgi:hypothetical protein
LATYSRTVFHGHAECECPAGNYPDACRQGNAVLSLVKLEFSNRPNRPACCRDRPPAGGGGRAVRGRGRPPPPGRSIEPVVVGGRRVPASRRARCRADILAALAAAGRPLTRKELAGRLRRTGAGTGHGAGTVAKALAELTASKALVNACDKRGYRLPAWLASQPTLFADARPSATS